MIHFFKQSLFPGAVILAFTQLSLAATSDTPKAHIEIEKYGNSYPRSQIGELKAIYREHIAEAEIESIDVVRNISYGSHPLHRLDVHRPQRAAGDATPILVFLHGGGFVGGDKSDGAILDNVLNYFASRGVLGINGNYRLAPEFQWPSGADDIRGILQWVTENAAEYRGDPNNVILMGHSAGASHVAAYTFIEDLQLNGGNDGVRGSVLVSGIYKEGSEQSNRAYYGSNPDLWKERMSINHIGGRSIPLFVISAEYDPTSMQKESIGLIDAICDRDDKCPRHKQVPGHNHFSEIYHINTADDSIASEIMDFISRMSRK